MYYVVTIATLITMALALVRAVLGPTVYDRVLSVNMFGTKTVLLLSVIAFLAGRPDFLDLALVYALINFIGVIAILGTFVLSNLGLIPSAAPVYDVVWTYSGVRPLYDDGAKSATAATRDYVLSVDDAGAPVRHLGTPMVPDHLRATRKRLGHSAHRLAGLSTLHQKTQPGHQQKG